MQRDLVQKLHLVRRQRAGKAGHGLGIIAIVLAAGHTLCQRDPMQQAGQIAQTLSKRKAAHRHLVGNGQQPGGIARGQRIEHAHQQRGVDRAEHPPHRIERHLAGAVGDRLIQQRQTVAHRTARRVAQHLQRGGLGLDTLLADDRREVPRHGSRWHLLEVELQAATQHSDRHLLRIGRGQDEAHVVGRLFQRLEHRVERMLGQHVHFIDHVDLVARVAGRVRGPLQQRHHVVHTAVAGGIHLDVVDEAAGVDRRAGVADVAGCGRHVTAAVEPGAVQRLGQDARQRGLADATRAGEQVGVVKLLAGQRMAERAHHVVLTDQRGEIARAPLARENLIRHDHSLAPGRGAPRRAGTVPPHSVSGRFRQTGPAVPAPDRSAGRSASRAADRRPARDRSRLPADSSRAPTTRSGRSRGSRPGAPGA